MKPEQEKQLLKLLIEYFKDTAGANEHYQESVVGQKIITMVQAYEKKQPLLEEEQEDDIPFVEESADLQPNQFVSKMHIQKIVNCARCGETHTDVWAIKFRREVPALLMQGVIFTPTHWATCPRSNDPIFIASDTFQRITQEDLPLYLKQLFPNDSNRKQDADDHPAR